MCNQRNTREDKQTVYLLMSGVWRVCRVRPEELPWCPVQKHIADVAGPGPNATVFNALYKCTSQMSTCFAVRFIVPAVQKLHAVFHKYICHKISCLFNPLRFNVICTWRIGVFFSKQTFFLSLPLSFYFVCCAPGHVPCQLRPKQKDTESLHRTVKDRKNRPENERVDLKIFCDLMSIFSGWVEWLFDWQLSIATFKLKISFNMPHFKMCIKMNK